MAIFEHFYNFMVSLLGSSESLTPQGEVFCRYGSYFLVGLTMFLLWKLFAWLFGKLAGGAFNWRR